MLVGQVQRGLIWIIITTGEPYDPQSATFHFTSWDESLNPSCGFLISHKSSIVDDKMCRLFIVTSVAIFAHYRMLIIK